MFSPEFTKFIMTYQMDEFKNDEVKEKQYIELKSGGNRLAEVRLTVHN